LPVDSRIGWLIVLLSFLLRVVTLIFASWLILPYNMCFRAICFPTSYSPKLPEDDSTLTVQFWLPFRSFICRPFPDRDSAFTPFPELLQGLYVHDLYCFSPRPHPPPISVRVSLIALSKKSSPFCLFLCSCLECSLVFYTSPPPTDSPLELNFPASSAFFFPPAPLPFCFLNSHFQRPTLRCFLYCPSFPTAFSCAGGVTAIFFCTLHDPAILTLVSGVLSEFSSTVVESVFPALIATPQLLFTLFGFVGRFSVSCALFMHPPSLAPALPSFLPLHRATYSPCLFCTSFTSLPFIFSFHVLLLLAFAWSV